MNLPKLYLNDASGRYPQHVGKPKISYSQYTSWKDTKYKPDYITQYFTGIRQEAGIYADFGGEVGKFIEIEAEYLAKWGEGGSHGKYEMLSEEDKVFLRGLSYPPNCVYEDEVVIDCGDFVIQGFTDRSEYVTRKSVGVLDYKTGNLDTKKDFYGSQEYGQTTLYCYQKVQEGFEIAYSKVILLGRKGNGYPKHPLRLSGDSLEIDTPYLEERALTLLEDIRKVAKEISDYYTVYLKYFGHDTTN